MLLGIEDISDFEIWKSILFEDLCANPSYQEFVDHLRAYYAYVKIPSEAEFIECLRSLEKDLETMSRHASLNEQIHSGFFGMATKDEQFFKNLEIRKEFDGKLFALYHRRVGKDDLAYFLKELKEFATKNNLTVLHKELPGEKDLLYIYLRFEAKDGYSCPSS